MKSIIFFLLFLALVSCSSDHKNETITNYLRFIWRINADNRMELLSVEQTGIITGKDSLEMLVKKLSQGEKMVPTADTLIANYEKDDLYNSNMLRTTESKIDSFKKINTGLADNSFYEAYTKSLVELRDFTASQLGQLRSEKNLLKKYQGEPEEILCYQVRCRYKIMKELPDTTSKIFTQIFYLSRDTKRVLLVKQDSSSIKKPGSI